MINSWQNDLANSVRSKSESDFPVLITPFVKDKIKKLGPNSALAKQFEFSGEELINQHDGLIDPIGDETHAVVPGLIHRYKNRALFTPTEHCPVHCRYCFRRNELGKQKDFLKTDFKKVLNYLNEHTEINEIIFTGGDPLVLSDQKIEGFLKAFAEITHIKYIRFHTRTPVVMPTRITKDFINILNHFQKRFLIFLVLHINHPDEWSEELGLATKNLNEANIKMLSQSVLLKGVNDNPKTLANLFTLISENHIRAYYLHHPDHVKGAMHFYLTLKEGREIFSKLRNCLPGWALPNYVIDIPGGAGKTPAFNPEAFDFSGNLINREGKLIPVHQSFERELSSLN